MRALVTAMLLFTSMLVAGCAGTDSISQEQIEIQNRADAVVSTTLFEYSLDATASYNVRKDGHVVIKFDQSVMDATYTEIVSKLRTHPDVTSVYAEQMGKQVCPLRP